MKTEQQIESRVKKLEEIILKPYIQNNQGLQGIYKTEIKHLKWVLEEE